MILIALAVLAANPATLNGVLHAAKPGDTVRLVEGNYPAVSIRSRTFDPPLTVDASAATVAGVNVFAANGVHWTGGTIDGSANPNPAQADYGFAAHGGRDITLTGVHITSFRVGIVFDRVAGGAITGNWVARMRSDGIDLSLSRSIVVAHNACSDFIPANGAHPDCIQAWSRPTDPPVADLTITGNSAVGAMQGISLFDGVHNGAADGGFDRVTITGNTVLNTYGDGIGVINCRGCSVTNNSVSSLPNYINRAQLWVSGGSVVVCGNDVPMVPRQSTPACTS